VDLQRAARAFRAVRQHQGLRQADVAERAGVSQQHVSDLERGRLGAMTVDEAERLFDVLDIRAVLTVSWRGGELDRLLDEGHAALGGACSDLLERHGWQVLAEVTFSVYGERGSIDLLAWHAATRTLLVIELKTELTSAEETLRRHDVKVRLAPGICRERFGARPAAVGRLLVVADTSANRARVARLESLLAGPYQSRGWALRQWLAGPTGPLGGVLFLNTNKGGAKNVRPKRVRSAVEPATAPAGSATPIRR
jgi:transcriptional regulator with XRE-family HTH domain